MIVLLIVSYLIGYIASYLAIRTLFKTIFNEWTISDRQKGLIVSLFSWMAFMAILFAAILYLPKNDKSAKW